MDNCLKPAWEFDRSTSPPSFYPAGMEVNNLVDVTRVGDIFRRYLDPASGRIHDGAEFFKRANAVLDNTEESE
jgi:hypothetical protein